MYLYYINKVYKNFIFYKIIGDKTILDKEYFCFIEIQKISLSLTGNSIRTRYFHVKNDKKDQRKDIKNPYGTISAEVFVLLASAERKMGQLDAALTHIQQALNKAPQDPVALLERGIIRERLGDMVGAKQDWQQVVAISPNSHESDMAQQDLDVMAADPESP